MGRLKGIQLTAVLLKLSEVITQGILYITEASVATQKNNNGQPYVVRKGLYDVASVSFYVPGRR